MDKIRIFALAACTVTITVFTIMIKIDMFPLHLSNHTNCTSMEPCSYRDEVVLRVIVLTYDRENSLRKCLDALQQADIMGVKAALEIWIDISVDGQVNKEVLQTAKSFKWKHGYTYVHIQTKHMNVGFQWIYTWQPRPGSKEIGVFIEDDVDVSKYFFRYLIKARNFYANYKEVSGICLNDQNCRISQGRGQLLVRPTKKTDNVFLYKLFCTWGYAPYPDHWRAFQEWYHNNVSRIPDFDPTAKEAELHSAWYNFFKKQGKVDIMVLEMFLIRYSIDHGLYTLHPNLQVLHPPPNTSLTTNRKEKGLHYRGSKVVKDHRLNTWNASFVKFPRKPLKYDWNGALIN